MTSKVNYTIFAVMFAAIIFAQTEFAQTPLPAPRQEKLLNGLKVLMWPDAKADKVSVKIRIHSGSAFDPQGKEGLMQMLADNLFPNEASREFFTEDLGGNLEIITNYDYIQINASSRPDGFLTMLETVATAVSNPAIDKETTVKLRAALLTKIASLEADPSYVADQAVAKRLFGTFPYGRPQYGTADSLKKIDFGDLIDAKTRFMTADNATLTISGNFDRPAGYRAIRRYFGGWLKADKKVPPTFRQPDWPNTEPLLFPVSGTQKTQVRFALRGVSRNDDVFPAVQILTKILLERLQSAESKVSPISDYAVRHDPHVLPGYLVFSQTFPNRLKIEPKPNSTSGTFTSVSGPPDGSMGKYIMIISKDILLEEFSTAKNALAVQNSARSVEEWWLDLDTFKTLPVNDEVRAFQNVPLADVQKIADKLAKNPVVSVVVHGVGETSDVKKN